MQKKEKNTRKGFTLVELIVVLVMEYKDTLPE